MLKHKGAQSYYYRNNGKILESLYNNFENGYEEACKRNE